MATELFHLRVLSRAAAIVLVEVTDTHHHISAPDTEGFFFAALHEPAQRARAPLAEACSVDQICDEGFVLENLRRYIAAVDVIEAVSAERATYRVCFTDPRWAAHLRRGLAWDSASYDLGEPTLRPALEALVKRARPRKEKAEVAPAAPAPTPAIEGGKAPFKLTVVNLASASRFVDLRVTVRAFGISPPVTAGFFVRALRKHLRAGGDASVREAWTALCSADQAKDDAFVAKLAGRLFESIEVTGWYTQRAPTLTYRLTFKQRKWLNGLALDATWTAAAREAGPATLERSVATMLGKIAAARARFTKKSSGA